jgi:hypothetical protein
MIISVHWSSCVVSVILVRFEWNLNFLDRFSKSIQIWNFMEMRPMGTELFLADGRTDGQTDRHRRTDMTKLIVVFRSLANAPENQLVEWMCVINRRCQLQRVCSIGDEWAWNIGALILIGETVSTVLGEKPVSLPFVNHKSNELVTNKEESTNQCCMWI